MHQKTLNIHRIQPFKPDISLSQKKQHARTHNLLDTIAFPEHYVVTVSSVNI